MAFISVTRLRSRSWRFMPGVLLHTLRSRRQLRGAPGFLGGYLAGGPQMALWTVTVWRDEQAMRAFRNAGAHLKAMPKLIDWAAESAVVHWTTDDATIPSPAEAAERMREGRVSKVRHPSPGHAAGKAWPDGKVPFKSMDLLP